jgi:hypothetical protein
MANAAGAQKVSVGHVRAIKTLTRRVWAGVFGAFCAILTLIAHAYYGFPVYGYLGLPYVPLVIEEIIFLILLAAIPGFFLPQKANAPSDFVVTVIYYYCYVPAITMMLATGLLNGTFLAAHLGSIAIGFLLVIFLAGRSGKPFRSPKMSSRAFVALLILLYLVFSIWIVLENYRTMRLVGFLDVYDQRALGGENIGTSGYALGMMAGAVNPLLMAYGLFTRRPLLFILGFSGQFLCYSVAANKIMLSSVAYIPAVYFLIGGRRAHAAQAVPSLTWMGPAYVSIILVGLFLATLYYQSYAVWVDAIASQILMRLLLLPGALTAQYAHFFETNPLTYMSHVGFGRLIAGSNYAESVSQTIGNFMAGGERGQNANVNFFAYDGIASFGPYGAPIIGVIVGYTLRLFNKAVRHSMVNVATLGLAAFAFNIAEGSYFSGMLTHGGGLLLILLYVMPYDD